MKDIRLYFDHILESIEKIERYTAEGRDAFFQDTMAQDAVLRNLQTLAESTKHIPPDLKAAYSEISWERIVAFRNILVHEYLEIRLIRIWEIIEDFLPPLRRAAEAMLKELEKER